MYLDSYKNCFSEFSNVKILLYYNVYTLYFTKFDSFTASNTSSVTLELSVIHDRTWWIRFLSMVLSILSARFIAHLLIHWGKWKSILSLRQQKPWNLSLDKLSRYDMILMYSTHNKTALGSLKSGTYNVFFRIVHLNAF